MRTTNTQQTDNGRATRQDDHAHIEVAEKRRFGDIVSANMPQITFLIVGIIALAMVARVGGFDDNITLVAAFGALYIGVTIGSLWK